MLERLTAGTLTLGDFGDDELGVADRGIVEYALRSRAEQAANFHKRGGSAGGLVRSRQSAKGSRPTRRDLIARLQTVARLLGHTPRQSDFVPHGLPALNTWIHHFGTYGQACRAAGLQPNAGRGLRRAGVA